MALFGRTTTQDQRRAEAYRDWIQKRHPLAIASCVLGLFSFVEFGALLIFGIAGIVLGIMALVQLQRASGQTSQPKEDAVPSTEMRGHRLAWTGIALSALSLMAAAALYFFRWPHG
jgi:hypothetical protein